MEHMQEVIQKLYKKMTEGSWSVDAMTEMMKTYALLVIAQSFAEKNNKENHANDGTENA